MMRLGCVGDGHGLKQRLILAAARLMVGANPADILRILLYRPKFWGKPAGVLTQDVLRGASDWTVGERELFATYVSSKNECRFCTGAHRAVTARALGGPSVVDAVLAGGAAEGVSPKAQSMLPFLEKLTVSPDQVERADVQRLRAAGIGDQAIADAIYVAMLFCMYNRIVDALGCEVMSPKQLQGGARLLLSLGYDI
jgi:uncharacterized peroxidase-related enzyme